MSPKGRATRSREVRLSLVRRTCRDRRQAAATNRERFAGAGPLCSHGARQVRRPSTDVSAGRYSLAAGLHDSAQHALRLAIGVGRLGSTAGRSHEALGARIESDPHRRHVDQDAGANLRLFIQPGLIGVKRRGSDECRWNEERTTAECRSLTGVAARRVTALDEFNVCNVIN